MPKFEYRTLYTFFDYNENTVIFEDTHGDNFPYCEINKKINELGAEGWELVSVTKEPSDDELRDRQDETFYFKRKI